MAAWTVVREGQIWLKLGRWRQGSGVGESARLWWWGWWILVAVSCRSMNWWGAWRRSRFCWRIGRVCLGIVPLSLLGLVFLGRSLCYWRSLLPWQYEPLTVLGESVLYSARSENNKIRINSNTRCHRFRWETIFSVKLLTFSNPYFLAYVLGAQKNRIIETVLLSTHNICFGEK